MASVLPILTFDERTLSPSFGYWFDRKWLDPYESIVSILWKFGCMNGLAGHMIAAQLAKAGLDPYEGVPAIRTAVNVRQLRTTLGLPLKLVRGALIPDSLQKIASPHFRFCLPCLRRGYHGVVHQFESVQLCPIHGDWLRIECPHCGQVTPYWLNARLLDAPYRCAACRRYYVNHQPNFQARRPLKLCERIAITRAKFQYYAT